MTAVRDEAPPNFILTTGALVPVRDGIRLATDIYRPVSDGPLAALLTRTPYA